MYDVIAATAEVMIPFFTRRSIMKLFGVVVAVLLGSACHADRALTWERDDAFRIDLPHLRALVSPTESPQASKRVNLPADAPAKTVIEGQTLPPEFDQVRAQGRLIDRAEAYAGFLDDAHVAWGQVIGTTFGNYFKNRVDLAVRFNRQQVGTNFAFESASRPLPSLFNTFGRMASTAVNITGNCGHEAQATGQVDAEMFWLSLGSSRFTLLGESRTDTDIAVQPECSESSGYGGGGSEGTDEQWYICYWVDYYDAFGRFVTRQNLGCVPIYDQ